MSRVRPVAGPSISLFPFLAVLLCTMGALLVLLVLFSRAARQPPVDDAAAAAAGRRAEELELAKEELAWRLQQLQSIRDRTADDLARARMQLAGVEEDARRITDQLDALERTAAALAAGGQPDLEDAAAVARLERELADARAALEAERKGTSDKPPAYAVVPYVGANGTHRRPLYIECSIDGVFLQPEGIRLGPADFEGPPGPGNPLASALRAAREHIAATPGESGAPQEQPYPLLLVRPSGVMAYYAAREAIQSWGSDFGYQFIDEEWELNYPAPDPALAEVERRAVEESRRRLAWLQQVRPTRPAKPATQYRAATTRGGVVANGGPSVLGDQSRFDWTEDQATGGRGTAGTGGGFGNGAGGPGEGGTGGGAKPGRGFVAGGSGEAAGGFASGQAGGAAGASGGVAGQQGSGGGLGDRYAGPSKFYAAGPGPAETTGVDAGSTGGSEAAAAGGNSGKTAATGGVAGGPSDGPSGQPSGSGQAAGAAQAGAADGGLAATGRGGSAAAGSGSAAGAAGATGGGGFGPSMPGLPQGPGGVSASAGSSAGGSLAGRRGSNWASLATHDRPVPLTRPIRVECSADEFRILADRGSRVEAKIPIGTHTVDSVDLLVQAVHVKVGGWGIAGDRMYWRPELVLSETADGRGRREDLERLLADSGLDTRRSGDQGKIRPLPPVRQADAGPPLR